MVVVVFLSSVVDVGCCGYFFLCAKESLHSVLGGLLCLLVVGVVTVLCCA